MVQARRTERLDQLVDELGADNVLVVAGDVRDPSSAEHLVSAAVARHGQLDSIVINAGIGMYGGILDRSNEDLQTMMRTNIEGTVWAARAAVTHFRPVGAGDIVIVASVAGLRGGADEAVYAATKFAQVGFAGALDREVRGDGIGSPRSVLRVWKPNSPLVQGAPKAIRHSLTTCGRRTLPSRSPRSCSNPAGSAPPNGSCGAWDRAS